MWYRLPVSAAADPDFISSATELLHSTFRKLVLVTLCGFTLWYLVVAQLPGTLGMELLPVAITVVLVCILALGLLTRAFALARILWQLGLAAAVTAGVYFSGQAEIAFLYALLPLVAVVVLSWPAGLLAEGLVIGLLFWLSRSPAMPSLPATLSVEIILAGGLAGLLGWAATDTLLTVTHWSLLNYEQALAKMEEARTQRMERKQVEEDLLQANRELARLTDRLRAMQQLAEEAKQAKQEFVANVSHELRTPLNMIIGFSEMILQSSRVYGAELPRAVLADIHAIERNSQHLAKLVDDVLDLSQIEAGRVALVKERVDLKDIIDAAAGAVRALFDSKGLYLETEVAPDLPIILCDATRIRQVVLNLLSNAGRFTDSGGVYVKAWREEKSVVVSVTDTGPGIAVEDQTRLFEPFYQLDGSLRRAHGGSGLGLSISKHFVELHGGEMWLASEVGGGTTFSFRLPIEAPLPRETYGSDDVMRWFNPDHQPEVRTRRFMAPTPVVSPRLVLLEQGDTLLRLVGRYMPDHEVVSFPHAERAMAELHHSPARALVVNTPLVRAGLEPLDQVAKPPYGTPTIACWVPGTDEVARQLGVVRYLVKPITRDTLLTTLASLGEDVRTVLLVDDEQEALQLFGRMLSSAERGYRVLRARSGQAALSLLRERQPDVMLLDLIMPGIDGFQVLREKSRDPSIHDIPVVVISSRDPQGEPIVSDMLTVTRAGGLSIRDVLACIEALSGILAPSVRSAGQARSEKPAA